jgi:DNA polymerase delta subunit 1
MRVCVWGGGAGAVQKPTPSTSTGIMRFSVKTFKCMACKTPMTGEEKTLCAHCQPREGEIFRKHLTKVRCLTVAL